jgi:hypothetical protein
MENSAPAKSLIRERDERDVDGGRMPENAERKMGEAIGDRKRGEELKATAQAWLVLAERIAQIEATEALKAKGK